MKDLAEKLYNFACKYDPYGAADSEYSIERAADDISNYESALRVIDNLLDIIEGMR